MSAKVSNVIVEIISQMSDLTRCKDVKYIVCETGRLERRVGNLLNVCIVADRYWDNNVSADTLLNCEQDCLQSNPVMKQ